MERFNPKLNKAFMPTFDEAPATFKRRIFGLDYIALKGMQGGNLYITRYGWPWIQSLIPQNWYIDGRFRETGRKLVGSTGTVYHLELPHGEHGKIPVLLKINRFAQDAPKFYHVDDTDGHFNGVQPSMRFLSPFEEFSLLDKLRESHRDTALPAVKTQLPLAIYCPPTLYPPWKLGRRDSNYWSYDRSLKMDQESAPENQRVKHEWERVYITVFHWVEGIDAQEAEERGLISEQEMIQLTRKVNEDLAAHGFAVSDNKPRHLILRLNRQGKVLRRNGDIPLALIDYELLYRPNHPRPTAPALD